MASVSCGTVSFVGCLRFTFTKGISCFLPVCLTTPAIGNGKVFQVGEPQKRDQLHGIAMAATVKGEAMSNTPPSVFRMCIGYHESAGRSSGASHALGGAINDKSGDARPDTNVSASRTAQATLRLGGPIVSIRWGGFPKSVQERNRQHNPRFGPEFDSSNKIM